MLIHDAAEPLAFLGIVVAVAAPLCGHQQQPFPPLALWRTLQARRARRGAWRGRRAPNGPSRLPGDLRDAPSASEGPSRATPAWAHTDHHTYEIKEAA